MPKQQTNSSMAVKLSFSFNPDQLGSSSTSNTRYIYRFDNIWFLFPLQFNTDGDAVKLII